jgi:NADPH-dependent 2,4-dienoyl-CoA reductase/sulfur reductase-like enzyme
MEVHREFPVDSKCARLVISFPSKFIPSPSSFFLSSPPLDQATEHHEVIIVGSGIAGLSAAVNLKKKHGITDVVVLEAKEYPGGYVSSTFPWS